MSSRNPGPMIQAFFPLGTDIINCITLQTGSETWGLKFNDTAIFFGSKKHMQLAIKHIQTKCRTDRVTRSACLVLSILPFSRLVPKARSEAAQAGRRLFHKGTCLAFRKT